MNEEAGQRGLRRDAVRSLVWSATLLGLAATGLGTALGLSPWFALKAVCLFVLACWLIMKGLRAHGPHRHFGGANRITLGRLSLVLLLAAALGEAAVATPAWAWAGVVVATTAALLDAADGPLARSQHLASAFGARFDMETDALLILVLCVLLLQFGKAGPWVLAAGLMRYAFVAAAWVWPWLAGPLSPSLRRKAVCVLQIVSLIVCLGPVIPVAWSTAIAAVSLAALTYSFAVDVAKLARARHQPVEALP
jgi:phosphatidylglycerophosphate synthase